MYEVILFRIKESFLSHNHNMQSRKKQNDFQNYEFCLNCAEQIGIKAIREQLEKMIGLDFLIGK